MVYTPSVPVNGVRRPEYNKASCLQLSFGSCGRAPISVYHCHYFCLCPSGVPTHGPNLAGCTQCAKVGCALSTATLLKRVSATWLFARRPTHLGWPSATLKTSTQTLASNTAMKCTKHKDPTPSLSLVSVYLVYLNVVSFPDPQYSYMQCLHRTEVDR